MARRGAAATALADAAAGAQPIEQVLLDLNLPEIDAADVEAVLNGAGTALPHARPSASQLKELTKALAAEAAGARTQGAPTLWSVFADIGSGTHKALVALLISVMGTDGRSASAVLAAQAYLLLLRQPGCEAYGILDSAALRTAMNVLRRCALEVLQSIREKPAKQSRRKPAASRRRADSEADDDDADTDNDQSAGSSDDQDEEEDRGAAPQPVDQGLLLAAFCVMNDTLNQVSLASMPDLVTFAADQLADVPLHRVIAPAKQQTLVRDVRVAAVASLKAILHPRHASSVACAKRVLKKVVEPCIAFTPSDSPASSASIKTCREFGMSIIQCVLSVAAAAPQPAPALYEATLAAVQHMCVLVKDRADAHTHAATCMTSILSSLPISFRNRAVVFISRASQHKKVPLRTFAVHAAVAMLTDAELVAHPDFQLPIGQLAGPTSTASAEETKGTDQLEDQDMVPRPPPADDNEEEDDEADQVSLRQAAGARKPAAPSAEFPESPMQLLVSAVLSRCMDKIPAVRARAVIGVGSLLVAPAASALLAPVVQVVSQVCETSDALQFLPLSNAPADADADAEDTPHANGPAAPLGVQRLLGMFQQRLADDKPPVRKAALSALADLATSGQWLVPGDASRARATGMLGDVTVRLIGARCGDENVNVRKAAIAALTTILCAEPLYPPLQTLWLAGVLPLTQDRESGVASKAMDAMVSVIVEPLLEGGGAISRFADRTGDEDADDASIIHHSTTVDTVWNILNTCAAHPNLVRTLQSAIRSLLKSTKCDPAPIIKSLFTAVTNCVAAIAATSEDDEDSSDAVLQQLQGCWILLEIAVTFIAPKAKVPTQDILSCWAVVHAAIEDPAAAMIATRIVRSIGELATRIPADIAKPFAEQLLTGLCSFTWDSALISAAIRTLAFLCFSKAPDVDTAHALIQEIGQQIIKAATPTLHHLTSTAAGNTADWNAVPGTLFTLGELAMLAVDGEGSTPAAAQPGTTDCMDEIPIDANTGRRRLAHPIIIKFPTVVHTLIQALIAPHLAHSASGSGSLLSVTGFLQRVDETDASFAAPSSISVPDHVRAHAFVALGKLCLLDSQLAEKYITVFVRELKTSSSSVVVRNNVLFVLGDLCIRYTQLVDRYVSAMALCLHDESPLVRRHAVMLLTHLLAEDYVKWRGVLFFHFITVLADSDMDVRSFAESALTGVLLTKEATLFSSNFVDTMVVLQGCTAHPVYQRLQASLESVSGKHRVGLPDHMFGPANQARRMHVYRTMLKHMSDEQRFTATARLAQDILGAAVDGTLVIASGAAGKAAKSAAGAAAVDWAATPGAAAAGEDRAGTVDELLRETFAVMSLKEIQISTRNAADADEDVPAPADTVAAAKSKVLSKLSRRNIMENVVPILVSLKNLLQHRHSPLLGPLMRYFSKLFIDYKEDMQEVLASDKQVYEELEYDLRMFQTNAAKAMKRRRTFGSTPTDTPGARPLTPGPHTPGALAAVQAVAGAGVAALGPRGTPKIKDTVKVASKFPLGNVSLNAADPVARSVTFADKPAVAAAVAPAAIAAQEQEQAPDLTSPVPAKRRRNGVVRRQLRM